MAPESRTGRLALLAKLLVTLLACALIFWNLQWSEIVRGIARVDGVEMLGVFALGGIS